MQTLYPARGSSEFAQISIYCAIRNWCRRSSLQPVLDRASFAPIQCSHFQPLHPLSFLYICSMHWCKHCTGLEVAPNLRKFPFTAICEVAACRIVCSPVLDGAPFVPTQGLHFQALHPLNFLFMCTLHWYKRCTGLETSPN